MENKIKTKKGYLPKLWSKGSHQIRELKIIKKDYLTKKISLSENNS